MPRLKCKAFKQSEDYPEMLMPCTEKRLKDSYFCAHHHQACREIMVGILNEVHEHDIMEEYEQADKIDRLAPIS